MFGQTRGGGVWYVLLDESGYAIPNKRGGTLAIYSCVFG